MPPGGAIEKEKARPKCASGGAWGKGSRAVGDLEEKGKRKRKKEGRGCDWIPRDAAGVGQESEVYLGGGSMRRDLLRAIVGARATTATVCTRAGRPVLSLGATIFYLGVFISFPGGPVHLGRVRSDPPRAPALPPIFFSFSAANLSNTFPPSLFCLNVDTKLEEKWHAQAVRFRMGTITSI